MHYMAKKKTNKIVSQEPPDIEVAEPEIRPSLGAYFKAISQLVWTWIKTHKLRALLFFMVAVVVLTGAVLLLRPSAGELTHDEIVIRVNKELSISGDANPAILTVEDKTQATQPFLQQAENGDKVLLYYKAMKSVLFRPSENRIVHQGAYTPPDAKVFVRKGTQDSTKVDEILAKLEDVQDIDVISQDSSSKTDYSGVTIVHVTDRYDQKVQELEKLFSTKVVRLPNGESFPDADILIIVGN